MKPPIAKKIPYKIIKHEVKRIDDYHWMRLTDKQKISKSKDPQTQDVLTYIKKENNYTKSILKLSGFIFST